MVTSRTVRQREVWLCALDPTKGSEIQKTRPCVIVSPDDINEKLRTVIVAPLTTGGQLTPFRLALNFSKKEGMVLPDQIRAIDKSRAIKNLGMMDVAEFTQILQILREMFEE